MDEIQKRYAAKIPDGNEQMAAATERLETVGKAYKDAESAAAQAAAAEAEARRIKEEQSDVWIDKFSPFFDSDTDQYLLMGASFNSASEEEQATCRKAYDKANELMATYETAEFTHGKTQHLVYLEQRLKSYLTMYNEGEARAKQDEACSEWVEKLRAYADSGAGSRKYLIVSVTLGEDEINERAALLEEAKAIWTEYEKAEFPLGKTPQLIDLEEELKQKIDEMPETLRQSRALVSGDIEKEFDRILAFLNRDTGWREDMTKTPNIAMERDLEPMRAALERYAGTVEPDDTQLATLREKMAQIEQTDQKNRAIRADRTFMMPDGYDDNDADDLREKAAEIVNENSPKAKVMRTTLPAKAWKEESVIEWTDTTRTAARYRCTRFMTVQAAAKEADGKVYLHSIHIASDQQADGSWGAPSMGTSCGQTGWHRRMSTKSPRLPRIRDGFARSLTMQKAARFCKTTARSGNNCEEPPHNRQVSARCCTPKIRMAERVAPARQVRSRIAGGESHRPHNHLLDNTLAFGRLPEHLPTGSQKSRPLPSCRPAARYRCRSADDQETCGQQPGLGTHPPIVARRLGGRRGGVDSSGVGQESPTCHP